MRYATNAILVLLLFFSPKKVVVADEANKAASEPKHTETNPMKSDNSSITISDALFEHLLETSELNLLDYFSLGHEEVEQLRSAAETAEKAAREKQGWLSTTGGGKIALKVGAVVTVKGLGEAEIDDCVAIFSKNLYVAISKNTQKALCIATRIKLRREFSCKFDVELKEQFKKIGVSTLPDGTKVIKFGTSVGSIPFPVMPENLAKYYLQIRPYKEGKPADHPITFFPDQIMKGQRYDFLTIETGDEAAMPAVEKPKEAPLKEKSR